MRQRYEARHLEEFGKLSYLAERLILEKGEKWEWRLTAEMMRYEIAPTLRRWEALKNGLYMKTSAPVEKLNTASWLYDRLHEIGLIVQAFAQLTNVEIKRAWGDPGVPGSDVDIVHVCGLYGELCRSTLQWEETVRFARMHQAFRPVQELCVGVAGDIIEQAVKIPRFIAETIADGHTEGTFSLQLTIGLPTGWADDVSAALSSAVVQIQVDTSEL